jgi:superfamily I DNA/RNA helicase
MNIKAILGPPGTGKTEELMGICKDAIIGGTSKNKIGFLSFTRQAAREAISRATYDYATEKELPYFRTIHSLAFWLGGIRTDQIIGYKHLAEFARRHNYQLTFKRQMEDGTVVGRTPDDQAYSLIQLAAVKMISVQEEWENTTAVSPLDIGRSEVLTMYNHYLKFKHEERLMDFSDMLLKFIESPKRIRLDLLCIDEAQDLSRLQWRMIEPFITDADQVYIVGDDDQAIFEWSGADIHRFQNYCISNPKILSQTHRYGEDIHALANKIIGRCKKRIPKDYIANPSVESHITRICDFDDVDWSGDVLVLARNTYQLEDVTDFLEDVNIKYNLLGQQQTKDRHVRIGTIHAAKGAQADKVVLLTDMSAATYESVNRDSEVRVWYVGATRAKYQLYIMEAKGVYGYDI